MKNNNDWYKELVSLAVENDIEIPTQTVLRKAASTTRIGFVCDSKIAKAAETMNYKYDKFKNQGLADTYRAVFNVGVLVLNEVMLVNSGKSKPKDPIMMAAIESQRLSQKIDIHDSIVKSIHSSRLSYKRGLTTKEEYEEAKVKALDSSPDSMKDLIIKKIELIEMDKALSDVIESASHGGNRKQ